MVVPAKLSARHGRDLAGEGREVRRAKGEDGVGEAVAQHEVGTLELGAVLDVLVHLGGVGARRLGRVRRVLVAHEAGRQDAARRHAREPDGRATRDGVALGFGRPSLGARLVRGAALVPVRLGIHR